MDEVYVNAIFSFNPYHLLSPKKSSHHSSLCTWILGVKSVPFCVKQETIRVSPINFFGCLEVTKTERQTCFRCLSSVARNLVCYFLSRIKLTGRDERQLKTGFESPKGAWLSVQPLISTTVDFVSLLDYSILLQSCKLSSN